MTTQYSVTIKTDRQVAGITKAREAANEQFAANPWDWSGPDPFVPFETNEDYLNFVLDRASTGYANSYGVPQD